MSDLIYGITTPGTEPKDSAGPDLAERLWASMFRNQVPGELPIDLGSLREALVAEGITTDKPQELGRMLFEGTTLRLRDAYARNLSWDYETRIRVYEIPTASEGDVK